MLQEQVARFVEGALRQTTPGRAFTLAVIAALPLMKASATAATLGTAAAKGGAAATGASFLSVCSVLLGPIAGCLGAWFGVKASLESAESEPERQLIRRQVRWTISLVVAALVAFIVLPAGAKHWVARPGLGIAMDVALPIFYVVILLSMVLRFRRAHERLRAKEAARLGSEAAQRAQAWQTYEYKSAWTLLGLPLVHVRSGRARGEKLRPAVGWIAIGDVAIGAVAVGGFAAGGLSIGGLSVGLLAIGGVSLGAVALAGVAIGLWAAVGGLAIGYLASGGCAVAFHAAEGGLALARDLALGGSASAAHANDAITHTTINAVPFFQGTHALQRHPLWFSLAYLPIASILWQVMRARRALKRSGGVSA